MLGLSPKLLLATAVLAAIGCQPKPEAEATAPPLPTTRPDLAEKWESQPIQVRHAGPIAVAQGRLPLVHRADSGGLMRIVDQSDGRVLVEKTVPPHTLIAVERRRGVVFDGEQVAPGPLSESDRFVIYYVPEDESVMRQGTIRQREPEKSPGLTGIKSEK